MKKLKIVLQSNIFYVIISIFAILFVFISTVIIKYDTKLDNPSLIEGVITDLDIKSDKISFILKSNEKIKCNYYLKDNSNDFKNLLGKTVQISGNTSENTNNTIPNTFNYKKYLYNNKIYLSFKVDKIKVLKEENIFYKVKNKIINRIEKFQEPIKEYLNLFILGDKSLLDSDMYEVYRMNGIWHLFAISGMHISLIIVLLNKLTSKLKFKKIIISLVLLYFMFLTSFGASVMRATIFYLLKNFLDYLDIKIDNKKILLLTAIIIILFNPFIIYNSGFQYSFLITYSIMSMSNKITGNYFVKIFKISVISFLVSLPITVNLNYEINLLSLILNIVFVPLISVIIFPLSLVTFLIPFCSPILNLLINILEFLNTIFYNIKLSIVIPKFSLIMVILYYTFLMLFNLKEKKKYLTFSLIIFFINFLLPKLDSNYYVYFIDVSQGDSSLIISPHQKDVVMIDTGGDVFSDYHVSNNVMLFLKSLGISKINLLILSHGDADHAKEALEYIDKFKVGECIFNNDSYNDLELNIIKKLKDKNIKYQKDIDSLNISDNKFYFLNTKMYDNENDNSNVLYIKINGMKFLFMGDAGVSKEKDIINNYKLQNIDVLKVGHHGSNTSSSEEFIKSINPIYSIISVGKKNRYGHPKESVLNTLSNSRIYRTDLDGTIKIKLNKSSYEFKTFAP